MEDMKGAFTSYDNFDSYVSMKIAQQVSGKQISMFNHIFEAINVNYNAGALVSKATKSASELTTQDIKDFTKDVKSLADMFTFPSTDYNKYGELDGANGTFKGFTNPDDVIIIATIPYLTAVDVEYLASAFNLDKAEIKDKIYKVPSFDYDTYTYDEDGNVQSVTHNSSDIQAIVCDRRLFRFSRDLDMDTEKFNEETLVVNYWSHAWYTYGINVMANNTVFVATETPAPTPFSAVADDDILSIDVTGATEPDHTTITVTPDTVTLNKVAYSGVTTDNNYKWFTVPESVFKDNITISAGANDGEFTVTLLTGIMAKISTALPDAEFDNANPDIFGTLTVTSNEGISAVVPLEVIVGNE